MTEWLLYKSHTVRPKVSLTTGRNGRILKLIMGTKAAILLVALLLSLAAPVSIQICASADAPVFVTLDVCNAAGTVLSLNAGMPVIQERTCEIVPPAFTGYINVSNLRAAPLNLTYKHYHPPEVVGVFEV